MAGFEAKKSQETPVEPLECNQGRIGVRQITSRMMHQRVSARETLSLDVTPGVYSVTGRRGIGER